jgi:hypothetical protein
MLPVRWRSTSNLGGSRQFRPLAGIEVLKKDPSSRRAQGSRRREGCLAVAHMLDIRFTVKIPLAVLRDSSHGKDGIALRRLQNENVADTRLNMLGHALGRRRVHDGRHNRKRRVTHPTFVQLDGREIRDGFRNRRAADGAVNR